MGAPSQGSPATKVFSVHRDGLAMGRLSHSWELVKQSAKVLSQDKELLWMPILSFLASVVAVMGIAGVGFAARIFPAIDSAAGALVAFSMYVALAFIALFFNAAVVAGAHERLSGGDPTVGSALRAAGRKAGKIFLWSLAVATVNVILQAIRERSGFLGDLLANFAGMAWNLATYFMVPILLFEDKGMGQSVRDSAGLFRKTWGQTVVGEAGIGLAATVCVIATIIVGAILSMVLGPLMIVGIILTVLAVVGMVAYFSTLQGVYKAALYRFATTGQATGGFAPEQLGGAFHAR